MKLNTKGFTLVELLVVVAIIGILSTLLTANFIAVRQRGRDSQRKSNLRQIQSALELYRSDQAGYPPSANFPACGAAFTNQSGTVTYMQKIPCDPSSSTLSYTYISTDTTKYTLVACLENTNDQDPQTKTTNPDAPCNTTTGVSYTLTQP